jgi:hypothetical protein
VTAPASGSAEVPTPPAASETALRLWERMSNGEDFWQSVYQGFKAREFTRADLASLIDMGLRRTNGSYRALLSVFNLPPSDYRRFHAFLYQQRCNLPVAPYRRHPVRATLQESPARQKAS